MYVYVYVYTYLCNKYSLQKSSPLEVLSLKCTPKSTTKSTGEHPCQTATPTKFLCSSVEVTLQCGCSNINKSPKPPPERAPPKGLHPFIFKNPN